MTSMPLTFNSTAGSGACALSMVSSPRSLPGPGQARPRHGLLGGAVARRQFLLGSVLLAQGLHQRLHVLRVGLIPVGHDIEFLAVPLDDARPVVAHVVLARSPRSEERRVGKERRSR